MAKKLTSAKAKEILHDKSVHGHPLTDKQRRFFGAIAGGAKPYKAQLGGAFLAPITPQDVSNFMELLSVPQKAITKLITGKYQTPSEAMGIKNKAGAIATDILLDPVNLLGAGLTGKAAKSAIAFKPKPGMMYRGLGKEGMKDAIESGVFRAKQNVEPVYFPGSKLRASKEFSKAYFTPNFETAASYGDGYIAEVPKEASDWGQRYGRKTWSQIARRDIPIEEGKILKKDWLRGYKEIKPKKKENGGWLDKYEQGGLVLKQKTHDNYGTKPNVNNDKATYPDGFVGWEYDITGRNYSPAWGGQFKDGGNLMPAMAGANQTVPMAQNGLTFLEPTSKKLPKGYVIPFNTPSTELAMSIGGEQGEPAYLIPSFKYGKPLKDPVDEFRKTGEHLGGPFKTYQEADEWERTVRHPYVEKGQSIPTPLKRWGKDFQMGGSLPGAVGFTYARTAGAAPDNGPYAKKTKASAQDGKNVKDDSNLENVIEIIDPTGVTSWDDIYRSYKKSGFSPETALEIFGALPLLGKVGKAGKITEAAAKTLALTSRQKRNVKAAVDILKATGKYGPSAGRATDTYQAYDQWQNGGEMKYYQAGLDFKPKTISQDGSEIPVDPNGYWNPENWGSPVTIPSTDITMEGVDQPLIGVSDTGDIKYMQPGEDYEFDGEYVTEYPVAKKGISVNNADAQPIKKLDQSLNFTNYNKPTKGGWLDKYQ